METFFDTDGMTRDKEQLAFLEKNYPGFLEQKRQATEEAEAAYKSVDYKTIKTAIAKKNSADKTLEDMEYHMVVLYNRLKVPETDRIVKPLKGGLLK